jgi:hypothetical protein
MNSIFQQQFAKGSINDIFPNDEGYALTLQALQNKFGEVVAVLRPLPGFHLFLADT